MTQYKIPFNKPGVCGREAIYMNDAIERLHISGDGYYTRACEALLENEMKVPKVLLTTSCTHALEMSALLLDIRPGDEIIAPSFTFVSTINAFIVRGARPVFADVRIDTLNLNERQIESLITERTRAIVVVHYAGVACEMDTIIEIASKYGLQVVEDNAHGLFGRYKGRMLGTIGSFATQSFHETKNFTCGEGGALVVNEPKYFERAEIVREKGTDRRLFFRGQVDKYSWKDVGSSYVPSDMLAAFLLVQLEEREQIQSKRRAIWLRYYNGLAEWASENGVILPTVPVECEQSYHMFYMLLPNLEVRQKLIQHLKELDILSVYHYLPLHLSKMGLSFGGRPGGCPVTENVSDRLLRLPFFNSLAEHEQTEVINGILSFEGMHKNHTLGADKPFIFG